MSQIPSNSGYGRKEKGSKLGKASFSFPLPSSREIFNQSEIVEYSAKILDFTPVAAKYVHGNINPYLATTPPFSTFQSYIM